VERNDAYPGPVRCLIQTDRLLLSKLVHIYADLKHAPRDILNVLKEADKFSAALKDVERLLGSPNGSKINGSTISAALLQTASSSWTT
jgi:hypothetical protein